MFEVLAGITRFFRRKRQQRRIAKCSHTPWIVLQRADDLWWKAFIGLEFYRGEKPPDGFWLQARVAICSRCGGVLDEITFANNALGEKDRVTIYPNEYCRYVENSGSIQDFK